MNSESSVVEYVIPNDGRKETFWVVCAIAFILMCAAFFLQTNQAESFKPHSHLQLSVKGKAVLTALSNAANEISFFAEDEQYPSIEFLVANEIPPFADLTGAFSEYLWHQPAPNCYVGYAGRAQNGSQKNSQISSKKSSQDLPDFMLIMSENAGGANQVFWRDSVSSPAKQALTSPCNHFMSWQTVENL